MLARLKKLFSNNNARPGEPHVVPAGQHPIQPGDISSAASKVVQILTEAGYEAYVVGGCIRDLLLELHPKDFDVATDATPEEVKHLFRRARIIGRRFRIVHVRFGREIVEVTTFRAHHDETTRPDQGQSSDQGMLLRDNIFGTIGQDASRRDFTINAMYYHPQDNTLYDYANGLSDIGKRQLRVIGDPKTRYREDPVRMLRAARFVAKLNFEIEPLSAKPIEKLAHLLADIPSARLFDESLKLFMSGYALATFRALRQYGLMAQLFPDTNAVLDKDDGITLSFIEQALKNTDHRILNDMRVTPAFLLAAFLWPVVLRDAEKLQQKGESPSHALQHAAAAALSRQIKRISIPKRFSIPMREIWELQLRLPNRSGKRAEALMRHPRFRAAYDFVLLREQSGEQLGGLGDWWTQYQEADPEQRQIMADSLEKNKPRRKRQRRRKPKATP